MKKEQSKKPWPSRIFVMAVMICLLIPTLGMSFFMTTETKEKTQLSSFPDLISAGSLNINFLTEAGGWYEEHFAFKEPLITLNSLILDVLQTSNQEKVQIGKNGRLFFKGELADYSGLIDLDERDCFNIASNLRLIQDYILSRGSQFRMIIVPNKATVDPEAVPKRYIKASESNLDKLQKALIEAGVNLVSIRDELTKEDYFDFDTHWTNQGAMKAYNKLMRSIGLEPEGFDLSSSISHAGDLSDMLFPSLNLTEPDPYDPKLDFEKVKSTQTGIEEIFNEEQSGVLLFYSDSFGEALLPFLASSFSMTRRDTLSPLNLIEVEQMKPDTVIIERAQRRMVFFEESAPIMIMPELQEVSSRPVESESTIEMEKQGSFIYLHGVADFDEFDNNTKLYLHVSKGDNQDSLYPVFYLGQTSFDDDGVQRTQLADEKARQLRNHGFGLYLPESVFSTEGNEITLLMQNDSQTALELKTVQATLQEMQEGENSNESN